MPLKIDKGNSSKSPEYSEAKFRVLNFLMILWNAVGTIHILFYDDIRCLKKKVIKRLHQKPIYHLSLRRRSCYERQTVKSSLLNPV